MTDHPYALVSTMSLEFDFAIRVGDELIQVPAGTPVTWVMPNDRTAIGRVADRLQHTSSSLYDYLKRTKPEPA